MDKPLVLDEAYWTGKYERGETGWDIGYVSTPIQSYIDQLKDKDSKILIPGAGNGYEAEYCWNSGFKSTHVVDLSETPLNHLKNRVRDFPKEQLLHQDFFDLKGTYDLIIEQTFFCALQPALRNEYALKAKELLKPGGKLVGLLFQIPLNNDKPPFGGSIEEYERLFSRYFNIHIMETSYNSIPPRQGSELFIKLINE